MKNPQIPQAKEVISSSVVPSVELENIIMKEVKQQLKDLNEKVEALNTELKQKNKQSKETSNERVEASNTEMNNCRTVSRNQMATSTTSMARKFKVQQLLDKSCDLYRPVLWPTSASSKLAMVLWC